MALNVLVSDEIAMEGVELLKTNGDLEVVDGSAWTREQLLQRMSQFHGLIVRSRTKVDSELIAAASNLRVIGRAGVGVDNVDLKAATLRGIVVTNSPEGNTLSTAEHTIAMMLSLARKIPQAHVSLKRDREWVRSRFMGVQVTDKTLGVIGLGRVGSEVAKRAIGLRMNVLAFDPLTNEDRANRLGVQLADIDEICREADFITVHTPLTKDTKGMLGSAQFDLMKRGVHIINCARGGIIDEEALTSAIEEGIVSGAALDVFVDEPPFDSPLLDMDQVVSTPHLAASTYEAQVNVAVDVVRAVVRALHEEPIKYAINAPAMRGEGVDGLLPYVKCAEDLGHFCTRVFGGNFDRIEVRYRGEALRFDDEALTSALLKGLLSPLLHETVNYVNAPLLAAERELRLDVVKEGDGEMKRRGAITVKGLGGDRERSVTGTVYPDRGTVLTEIDGYSVNVEATGRLLIAYNVDRPGIIGLVGTLLGEHNINIASMQVGRKKTGNYAVMLLGIDEPLNEEVIGHLNDLGVLKNIRIVEWNVDQTTKGES